MKYRTYLPVAALLSCVAVVYAQDLLDEGLEKATKAAVAKVAPTIVQIRTVGGLDVIGQGRQQITKGQGPTTGVIVSEDGFIVSSSFNFANKPSAITVTLPEGKEPLNARVIATDHTRMLTLLKVEATGLPVPVPAPKSEVQVGQWSLALGKTWSESASGTPSVSVGIVSAKERIWGRAMQTDAKVSPINYGGPLVDVRGRVLGIIVPLSPQASDETAGVEWYDGGIGFAIPLEDVNRVLPRLKEGKDLKKGMLGIRMKSTDRYSVVPVIGTVAHGSAAAKAGLQSGDVIVGIDDKPVTRTAQFLHVLDNKYEGDTVALKIKRGEQVHDFPNVELTGPPAAHLHAYLGILPMRDDAMPGVVIRHVFADSPAAKAGLKNGDRIAQVDKRPVRNRDALLAFLNVQQPGAEIELSIQRKEENKGEVIKVKLGEYKADLPPEELPEGTLKKAQAARKPPMDPRLQPMRPMPNRPQPNQPQPDQPKPEENPKEEPPKPPVGFINQNDPVSGREGLLYVPEDYDPNVSYSLLVWLQPAGDFLEETIKKTWRDLCRKHHVILYAPKAENPTGWLTSEADYVRPEIAKLQLTYVIDPQRIVLHGLGNGATFALYLGFDARDVVRGVAAFSGSLSGEPKGNEANERLNFFLVAGAKDPAIAALRSTNTKLTEKLYPVVYQELPEHGDGYVTDTAVIRDLVRWLEGLDRL